jgi:hypothetical protein
MSTTPRYCVIGAGYAGNGVAKAFKTPACPMTTSSGTT